MTDDAPPVATSKPRWGWIEHGQFRRLPMVPGFEDLEPPPFDAPLPRGEVRHVVEAPELG
jgi:hypothetical protein